MEQGKSDEDRFDENMSTRSEGEEIMKHLIITALSLSVLSACGGGGGGGSSNVRPDTEARLAFPHKASGHYRIDGLPRLTNNDAKHMPVYRDGSPLLVGVDQGTQYVGRLTSFGNRGSIQVRHGRLNDGVGSATLSDYLRDATRGSVRRYRTPPQIQIIGQTNAADADRVIRAVQLLNASMPEHAKLRVVAPSLGFSLRDNVGSTGLYYRSGEERADTIYVEFVPENDYRRDENSAAVTWGAPNEYAYIQFNMGANSYSRDREAIILLAHELMHAISVPTIYPEKNQLVRVLWIR